MQPMKRLFNLALVAFATHAAVAFAQGPIRPFIVTHALRYQGDVDLTSFGVLRTPVIYEGAILSKDNDDPLPMEKISSLVKDLSKGPLPTVIDIERWPLVSADSAQREVHAQKLAKMADLIRQIRPDMEYGFYGVLPRRVYWPLVSEGRKKEKNEWTRENDRARGDLANKVDAIFPSLYTFYKDRKGWERYAVETIKEARKFGKPVYCFLWPQFQDRTLRGQYLARDYWRFELETCRMLADGIVIWNSERQKPWDPQADWWLETVDFMEKSVKAK